MKGIVGRASAATAALGADRPQIARRDVAPPIPRPAAQEGTGAEMAGALAAAVERLRARAEGAPPAPEADPRVLEASAQGPEPSARPAEQERARRTERPAPHKHSMSWFARRRIRRKQRRGL
jgi:hypothetical protein